MSKFPENSQFRQSPDFSKRIKRLIYENDCTSNQDFAQLVGISSPVIKQAVNFGIIPSTRLLIKISDKLELSIKYLLGIENKNEFMPSANPSTFHIRLPELTAENKTNYGKLATKMNFPRTYFYEWLKQKTLPSIEYIFEIANCFKVSPDYLLGRTDYRNL